MKWFGKASLGIALLVGTLLVGVKLGAAQVAATRDPVTYLAHPVDTGEILDLEWVDLGRAKMISVKSKNAAGDLQLALYDVRGNPQSVYCAVTKREGKPDLQDWTEVFVRPKTTKFDLTPIGEEGAAGKAGAKAAEEGKAAAKAPEGKAKAKAE